MNENDFDKLVLTIVAIIALTIMGVLTYRSLETDRYIAMTKAGLQQCDNPKSSTPLWQKKCK